MAATVSLAQMVDLALGTPEVGAVNFNVLHTLLHAMLTKLDLSNTTTELSSEDRDLLANANRENTIKSPNLDGKDGDNTDEAGQDGKQGGGVASKKSPYHVLQNKVAVLEEQMQKLNDLPSNADLFERAKPLGDGERPRPVADMWQNVQLKNRVDANEEGIGKLMSLVEEMVAEMNTLKADSNSLRSDLDNHNIPGLRTDFEELKKRLEDLTNKMNNMSDLDELRKRLSDLETLANALNDQLSKYPEPATFIDFVTWKALEEALKGLRDELEPKERIVIDMQTQTSRPTSGKAPSRPPSSRGPSEELQKMLESIGLLTDRHDKVEVRVDKLEEEMPNKADKADLAKLSAGAPIDIPEDLLVQLKDLQDQLKALGLARDKLTALEEKLSQLPDFSDMEENIDGLNLGHEDLQRMIDGLRTEYEATIAALEDKLNSIQELVLNATLMPEPISTTPPRTPSPTVKLPPIPGASPAPDTSGKLADLEYALKKKDNEIRAIQQKMKWLMTDTNKQVVDIKDKLKNLQQELINFGKQRKPSSVHSSKTGDMDSEALSRLQQIVLQLQAELDRVQQTANLLTDENNNKTKQIEGLLTTSDKLERIKADKEYVQNEVDVKADKHLVEGKVNRSLFDQTTDELNKTIKELLNNLSGKEDEWKQALGTMTEDVDGKLDRLEFGPIRDELERRLKSLARQLRELSLRDGDVEDDAAGIRRQLIQRYHCISCDRAVDMMPQGPIPSIPAPQGLPATRTSRPYTTFELEQIRQHARSLQQPGADITDLYATTRACGGTHTVTQPHRRITRVTQFNNLFRDEEVAPPSATRENTHTGIEELDIQGADGHIYKGRLEARLPSTLQQSTPGVLNGVQHNGQSPKMTRKIIYAQAAPRPPATAAPGPSPPSTAALTTRSPRPASARTIKPSPVTPKEATIPTGSASDLSTNIKT